MKKKIRILITGSKGFVGSSLTKIFKEKKKLIILNDDKEKFDLSKSKKFKQLLILTITYCHTPCHVFVIYDQIIIVKMQIRKY